MIGKREDAVRTQKVGGKAFPEDYNWECDECGANNRSWEAECYPCEYREYRKQHPVVIVG